MLLYPSVIANCARSSEPVHEFLGHNIKIVHHGLPPFWTVNIIHVIDLDLFWEGMMKYFENPLFLVRDHGHRVI